ncbi:hypothetical protein Tco_0139257 [Tanacetum coccineum]
MSYSGKRKVYLAIALIMFSVLQIWILSSDHCSIRTATPSESPPPPPPQESDAVKKAKLHRKFYEYLDLEQVNPDDEGEDDLNIADDVTQESLLLPRNKQNFSSLMSFADDFPVGMQISMSSAVIAIAKTLFFGRIVVQCLLDAKGQHARLEQGMRHCYEAVGPTTVTGDSKLAVITLALM